MPEELDPATSGTGDPPPDTSGTGTGADKPDGGTDTGGRPQDSGLSQDEVNRIVAREVAKAQRGKLDPRELGFESGKDLKEFLDKQKEVAEQAKSESEKALEQAKSDATKAAEERVLSKANERFLKAEFVIAANKAGVSAPADAYVLAKTMDIWTQVELVESGDDVEVKGFDEDFFKQMKEQKPYLFVTAGEQQGGDLGGGAANADRSKDRFSEENLLKEYTALRNR